MVPCVLFSDPAAGLLWLQLKVVPPVAVKLWVGLLVVNVAEGGLMATRPAGVFVVMGLTVA